MILYRHFSLPGFFFFIFDFLSCENNVPRYSWWHFSWMMLSELLDCMNLCLTLIEKQFLGIIAPNIFSVFFFFLFFLLVFHFDVLERDDIFFSCPKSLSFLFWVSVYCFFLVFTLLGFWRLYSVLNFADSFLSHIESTNKPNKDIQQRHSVTVFLM